MCPTLEISLSLCQSFICHKTEYFSCILHGTHTQRDEWPLIVQQQHRRIVQRRDVLHSFIILPDTAYQQQDINSIAVIVVILLATTFVIIIENKTCTEQSKLKASMTFSNLRLRQFKPFLKVF